ncbi:MAG: VOC family protein [Planctomycetes bacterium]|nr:VOC family protein [Planctomycetota bacterium]
MPQEPIEFLSAVLLVSRDPERLAKFYRDVLGVPLEDERHGETLPHWGCTMGDVHFAIHPVEDFPEDRACAVGSVKLAFTVFDLDGFVGELKARGVEPLYPPRDEGFCRMTALRDPDGNHLEFTELGEEWFRHLEERRAKGSDILERWKRDCR